MVSLDVLAAPLLRFLASTAPRFGRWVSDRRRVKRNELLEIARRPLNHGGVWTLATTSLIVQADLDTLARLPLSSVYDWLVTSKGAYPWGERYDGLRLSTKLHTGVIIEEAEADIIERSSSRNGAIIDSPSAGAQAATFLGFDLTEGADHRAVTVIHDIGHTRTSQPYFRGGDIRVDPDDSLPLNVTSRTRGDTVRWRIRFTVTINEATDHFLYPPLSQPPLVTTAVTDADQYWHTGIAGLPHRPWIRAVTRDDLNL